MNSRSLKFPKGEYFFGDLANVIPSGDWSYIFCANDEGDWEYKNKDYFLFNTGADGYFLNHRSGESVPVDSHVPKQISNLSNLYMLESGVQIEGVYLIK